MSIIKFNNVSEKYRIKFICDSKVSWEEVWALQDINFSIERAEIIGVIGQNGSGKTTLLRLIAGMLVPDKGDISVNGRVSAIMELGGGLNPEFTGRENIVLNARLYGISDVVLESKMEDIIDFSGLGKFISAPIKYYSQGMYMRLAFALAIFSEPDILLIDDILAVGDEEAQKKCLKKVFELKESGKTIVLVSHDMGMINKLCSRVLLFDRGRVVREGSPQSVVPFYLETSGDKKGISVLEEEGLRVVFNNGRVNLSYAGGQISSEYGCYMSFFDCLININSSSCNLCWDVKSTAKNQIVAEGTSRQDDGISQTWKISLSGGQVDLDIIIHHPDKISRPSLDMLFQQDYNAWSFRETEGRFPDFAHKHNWFDIGLQACYQEKLFLSSENNPSLPGIMFEVKNAQDSLKAFNSGYEQESRILRFSSDSEGRIMAGLKAYSSQKDFQNSISNEREKIILTQARQKALARQRQEEEDSVLKEKEKTERELYIQQHTISHGNLRLFADIKSRRLCIFFKDREITAAGGINYIFPLQDLNESLWVVDKISENKLKLNLNFNIVKQEWQIKIKDNEIHFNIVNNKTGDIPRNSLDIFIPADYKKWFFREQEGVLPDFSHKYDWLDTGIMAVYGQKLFLSCHDSDFYLGIVVATKDSKGHIKLFNSGRNQGSRVLQFSSDSDSYLSIVFAVFSDKNEFYSNALKEKHIKQEQEKIERELYVKNHTISAGNLSVFADSRSRRLCIFFKDKEVTAAGGINSISLLKDLPEEFWQVEKCSCDTLNLILGFGSIAQFWQLTIKQDNIISLKIQLKPEDKTPVINRFVRLELSNKYDSWQTQYERGIFSNQAFVNDISPVRLKDTRLYHIACNSSYKDMPGIVFKVLSDTDLYRGGIFRQKDNDKELSCLSFYSIVSWAKRFLAPGKQDFFQADIIFDNEENAASVQGVQSFSAIKRSDLELNFDRGSGRIICNGREITSALGVYTAVRSQGIWYDSLQAAWSHVEQTKTRISASGEWPYIPISQLWSMELIADNMIKWAVTMKVYDPVHIEIEQANIMLTPEYNKWRVEGSAMGDFTEDFTEDYDILPFRFWYGNINQKGLIASCDCLPEISFSSQAHNTSAKGLVENSDFLYRSRLLQHQRYNKYILNRKNYQYFTGIIKVGSKK